MNLHHILYNFPFLHHMSFQNITGLGIYILLINIWTFCLYGYDKYQAIHHGWRVPEARLLLSAFAGGSVGALLAMMVFRHKTRHVKFNLGVPLILLFHILLLSFLGVQHVMRF